MKNTKLLFCCGLLLLPPVSLAENLADTSSLWDQLKLDLSVQANFRNSQHQRLATGFPFPPELLPVGQSNAFLETVEAGSHYELSDLVLNGAWQLTDRLKARFKVEFIDLYDRNPTSNDREVDLDLAWLRYGNKFEAWEMPPQADYYLQIGKFEAFERQNDRHLQSYGLVSTAFNRFEDSGIELGFNGANGFYSMLAVTTGNPVFMRDANALAGDNGTPDRNPALLHPNPALKSGFPLLYDAEIEDFDLSDPQWALGLGWRFYQETANLLINGLIWGNHRQLQPHQTLHGTFYGADLDLLDLGEVPGAGAIRLDITDTDKTDYGANLAVYAGDFSFFAQFVQQQLGGMRRQGWETELAYRWSVSAIPGLQSVTPVLRYSILDPDFTGSAAYPAPSVFWHGRKVDYGFRLNWQRSLQLTFEYAQNDWVRAGQNESTDEYLVTLKWQYSLLN